MSNVVAIVKSIVGQVFAVSPEGIRRVLIEGDRLFVGDQVDTGLAGAVTLELADGRILDLGRDTQWSGTDPDSSADLAQATAQAVPSVEELQQAIAAGADPTAELEATAAGPSAAGAGGAAGGGHSFVVLDATAGRVDPTIGFPTAGIESTVATTTDFTGGQSTTATNAPSLLTADAGTLAEDTVATGNVLGNDSVAEPTLSVASFTVADVAGSFIAGQTATIVGVGTLTLGANGDYSFTPVDNYNGAVPQVTYTTNTGSTSTLDLSVTAVNDPSVLTPDAGTLAEDTVATGNALSNDNDVDNALTVATFTVNGVNATFTAGQTATIEGVGTLVITANGDYTFTPAANYNGSVPTANYTTNTGSTSTLDISITPVNDSFTDASETVSGLEDSPVSGSVLTDTSSVDGPVSVVNFTIGDTTYAAGSTATIANVGTLVIGANGAYTFTPAANYNGTVPNVSYSVTDGSGSDVTSILNISVTPVDDSFTDASETVSGLEDSPVSGSVLTGTSSVDGAVSVVNFSIGETTYAAGSTATIANVGTLVIAANGVYTFNPATNYNGPVPTVSYTVTDGSGTDVTSTLNISVTPVDDPSVLTADTNTVAEDTIATGNVLGNDGDIDNELSVIKFTVGGTEYTAGNTAPIQDVGTLVIAANGVYTFTPGENYNGAVPTVSYTTNTGSTSTLNISVAPVNDAPTVNSTSASGAEDQLIAVQLGGTDLDGSVGHFTLTGLPANGRFYADAAGTLALNTSSVISATANGATVYFKPTNDWSGTTSFTYSATDNLGMPSASSATGSIVVAPVDDVSVLTADTHIVDEDRDATGNVLDNDDDVESDLSVVKFTVGDTEYTAGDTATLENVGKLTLGANGDYRFTPDTNYNGVVPTVSYATNTGSTSTLNISVAPFNDAPTVNSTSASGAEDQLIAVQLGGTDLDGSVGHFTLTGLPANGRFYADAAGTLALSASSVISATANDATVYFKPTGDWSGTTSFTYSSTDNLGMPSASSATGTVVVASVTDTPSLSLTGGGMVASTDFQEVALNGSHSDIDVSRLGNGVWHTDNSGGKVEIGKASTYGAGGDNQVIELERNTGDASNLYTTIEAKAGTTYNVSFDYAPRAGVDNSLINVYWGGQLIGTLNTATSGMQHYSFDVPVTADGSQKLEFRAGDSNSLGGLLDNISVTQVLNSGLEDHAILLSTIQAHTNDVDGSETLTLTLNNLPAGAKLTDGTHTFNAADGSTSVDVTGWNLSTLTLTPPTNFNGDISLTVTATAKDGDAPSASTSLPLVVHVAAVDDASVLQADQITVDEDHNATGNVLTYDRDIDNTLSVTSFSVKGIDGSIIAGQLTTIIGVGTLSIASNGDYSFKPAPDWNGDVPQVTYTTNTGSSTTLDISVTAVADKPTILVTTPPVTSTGLTEQVWAPSTALYNALGSGGNGATAATLIAGIDGYTAKPATTTTVHDFASSTDIEQGTATKASGLIYLEAGKAYAFAGNADDSLAVTVGGNTVASATWGNQSGTISGNGFTPTVSGYYTLDIYHFNQNGPGNYNLTVSVNGGTATSLGASNLLTFTDVDDMAKAGLTVSDLHGLNGEGYYTVSSINHGQQNTFIKVSPITATYTDNDGSQTHVTTLSGIPVGSVLMDGTGKSITASSTAAVDLNGWDTQTLSIKPPTDWTGTINLTVTATATEKSNESVASQIANIDVTVDAANHAPVTANSTVQGTEDTPLTLTWNSLHVSDADTAASKLSIIVTQLPVAGKLSYNDGTGWKDVTVGTVISKSIVDGNGLVFVPGANQSGGSNYTNAGLGDQKTHYAQFQFQPFDGADKGAVATVTLDIAPTADAPIVSATHTQVVENSSVALGLKATSLDTDGSETQTITKISGIPVGATLTDGMHTFTGTTGSAVAALSGWEVNKLSYTPAPYTSGTNTLTVTAVSTESHTTQSLTTTTPLNITVTAGVYDHQDGKPGTDTLTGTASNDILVGDTSGTIVVEGKNYNIAFILDSSGSMSDSLATAKAQLKTVFDQLTTNASKANAGTVNLYALDFGTSAGKSVAVDLSNKDDAMAKLTALLKSIKADGVTNYEDAFKTTANWFHSDLAKSNVGATNLTFFITDGQPNSYQNTASTVIHYNNGTEKVLSEYIGQWKPGTALNVSLEGKEYKLISAEGYVYTLVEKSTGNSGKFDSYYLDTLSSHADGYGGTEYSLTMDSSSSTVSINNAKEGYAALSTVSTVEAIGINSDINKSTLQLFDTDHVVQIGVSAGDLASAIQGTAAPIAPGGDDVNGGNGNDILFGDLVSFNGISGNGVQAIQAFVASKTGVADASTVTDQQMHQYITNHVSEFNVTGTTDGKDTLLGDDGNDILFGQGGIDTLYGGNGNDTLIGGRGDDALYGGSGADTFTWLKGDTGNDVIKDFKSGDGDRIDLRDLLQVETGSTIENFLKITTTAGGVSTLQVSSEGKLNADGGIANADVTIKLEGNNWTNVSVNSLISGGDPTIKVDHNNS